MSTAILATAIVFGLIGLLALFVVTLVFAISFSITYSIYTDSCKKNNDKWNYGTFDDFKREFYSRDWTLRDWQKLGDRHFWFSKDQSSISQFKISFANNGMILKRKEYIKYWMFLNKLNKIKKMPEPKPEPKIVLPKFEEPDNRDTNLWKR